jgi:hypothetical protein
MGHSAATARLFKSLFENRAMSSRIPVFIPRILEAPLKVKFDTIVSDKDVLVDYILSASPQDLKNGFANFYTNGLKNLKPGLTYLIIHTAYDDEEMRAITIDHPDWALPGARRF